LLRKLLKKQMRPPRVMITDKLASYGAAKHEVMPGVEHRQHKGLNNRANNAPNISAAVTSARESERLAARGQLKETSTSSGRGLSHRQPCSPGSCGPSFRL
jgi:hypothetical protein